MDKEIEIFREEVARWRGGRRRGARRSSDAMRARALRLWDRLRQQGIDQHDAAPKEFLLATEVPWIDRVGIQILRGEQSITATTQCLAGLVFCGP
jgi:hypothetical protein